ncbi:unnamed protein product [Amaranthus hypochondriacus]
MSYNGKIREEEERGGYGGGGEPNWPTRGPTTGCDSRVWWLWRTLQLLAVCVGRENDQLLLVAVAGEGGSRLCWWRPAGGGCAGGGLLAAQRRVIEERSVREEGEGYGFCLLKKWSDGYEC